MSADSSSEYSPSLAALRQLDENEWERFHKKFFRLVCHQVSHSMGWLLSKDASLDVADIAQESMTKFLKSVTGTNSPPKDLEDPIGYLLGIAKKTASSHWQKATAQKRGGKSFPVSRHEPVTLSDGTSSNELHETAEAPAATAAALQEKLHKEVLDALNLLEPFDRKLLINRFLIGYKQRELEEIYGKKSMGVVLSRALLRARKILSKAGLSMDSWEFPDSPDHFIEESEEIYHEKSHRKAKSIIEGKLDVNGDGKVDMEDLREFRRRLIGWRKDQGNLSEDEKKQLDINEDGAIDELDFIALGMAILRAGISPEEGAQGIARGDLNNDGRIDLEDLGILRLQLDLQAAGESLSPETISNLDIDGDGKLDENDFIDLTMLVLANEAEEGQRVGLENLLTENPLLQREFDLLRQQAEGFQSIFGVNKEKNSEYTLSAEEGEHQLNAFLMEVQAKQIAEAAKELAEQDIPEIEKKADEAKVDVSKALEETKKALEEASKKATEAAVDDKKEGKLDEAAKPLEQAAEQLAEAAKQAAEAAKEAQTPQEKQAAETTKQAAEKIAQQAEKIAQQAENLAKQAKGELP